MKIIVCGGRNYFNKQHVFNVLSGIHEEVDITEIITGDAPGADTLAAEWAKSNKITYVVYRALWDIHGKAAGPIRNEEMLSGNLDAKFLVAFPGGKGTMNAIGLAEKYKLPVIKIQE
jgi:hypothetical protein